MGYLVHVPETGNVVLRHGRVGRVNAGCNARDGYLTKISLVTIVPTNYVPVMLSAGLSVVIVPVHTSIIGPTLLK